MDESISIWESPRTSDWDKNSVNETRKDVIQNEFVLSDESSYEEDQSDNFSKTEEYFTSFVRESGNANLCVASCNLTAKKTNGDEEKVLQDIEKLTLNEEGCTNVDILTPSSKTSENLSNEEAEVGKIEAEVRAEAEAERAKKEAKDLETKKSEEEENDQSEVSTDESSNAKKVALNKKLEWTPKGSQPRYMNKSEELKKKIELARKKAATDTSKNKNNNLNRDSSSNLDDIRQRIAANNKALAEKKAAIVLKEKQRVQEAAKARKEAREKYIQEARQKADLGRVTRPRAAKTTV